MHLLVLIPLVSFAVVALFSFVGCDGPDLTQHPVDPFTHYGTDTVMATGGLVSFWRLDESGGGIANDSKGSSFGIYETPPDYPSDSANESAPLTGPTYSLSAGGILPGELDTTTTNNNKVGCVELQGGYISVSSVTGFYPTNCPGFTIEAWVCPDWSGGPAARRVVAMMRDTAGKGFAIYANSNNEWEAWIGPGQGQANQSPNVLIKAGQIYQQTTYYLAITLDSTSNTFSLYVDGALAQSSSTGSGFPLFAPTYQKLYIGAGSPELGTRTQNNQSGGPLNPFLGKIQAAALYNVALSAATILKHAHHGNHVGP